MAERETEIDVFIKKQLERQEAGITGEQSDDAVVAAVAKIEVPVSRAERKARLASVLERGAVNPRLEVKLPSNLHGEWVSVSPVEIMRMESLGYKIDTEFAPKRALHTKGDGASILGDVLFMTTDKENYEVIQEVYRDQYLRLNHPKRQSDGSITQREEAELVGSTKRLGLQPMMASDTREARKAEIEAVLQAQTE